MTLARLVSGVFPLEPPYPAVPVGNVMVTLAHNAPTSILEPGRKPRRGRGLPLTWKPSGIYVSTEDVPITVPVVDVKGADEFPFPLVSASLIVRVNPADEYANLMEYIRRKGINFAELLDLEIHREISERLRIAFSRMSATDVWKGMQFEQMVSGGSDLLGGLFLLVGIVNVEPTFHPEFQRIMENFATTQRELVEKENLLRHAPVERELARAEDALLAERAAVRGVDINELERPELLDSREGRRSNEFIAALGAIAETRGRDNLDLLRSVMGAQAPEIRRPTGDRFLPPHYERDTPAPAQSEPRPLVDATPEPEPEPDSLKIDPALARLWKANGFDGFLRGASLSIDGDECVVVVVPSDATDPDLVRKTLTGALGATHVITLNDIETLDQLVGDYLEEWVPELSTAAPTITLDIRGLDVKISLSSQQVRLGPIVRSIRDQEQRILRPLATLLGSRSLDVAVVES